jgi:hypothetical protein
MQEPGTETLDALIAANAELLDITIDPAWMPAIRQNLAVTYRMARFVEAFALPDDAEPAPVFEA